VLGGRLPGSVGAVPETNMVLVGDTGLPGGTAAFAAALEAEGILAGYIRPGVLRFCTHHDVGDADVDRAAAVAASLVA